MHSARGVLTGIRASGTYVTISGSVAVYATAYDYTYVYSRKGLRMLPPEWVYNERYVLYSSLIPLVVSASLNSQYNSEFHLDYRLRPAHSLTSDQEEVEFILVRVQKSRVHLGEREKKVEFISR